MKASGEPLVRMGREHCSPTDTPRGTGEGIKPHEAAGQRCIILPYSDGLS